jgi:cbb3-type cytochrome oxidase subunit 3
MRTLGSMLVFLLKCTTFSVIFVAIWQSAFRPANGGESDRQIAMRAQANADAYDAQLRQSGEQLARSEQQQQLFARLLSDQIAQSARYEEVLQRWERQSGVRK